MHLSNVTIAVFIAWILSLQNDSTDAKVTGISFEGCFKNLSNFTTRHNLSDKNDPRHCFDECYSSEYIGLQKEGCFCNATLGDYATERDCGFSCPGDGNFLCGSDHTIYVYYFTEQSTIGIDGEFGFVYLHVFFGVTFYRYEIYGTNNITARYHYICYDDARKCDFKTTGLQKTWHDAKHECLGHNQGLVPLRTAEDERICKPVLQDGYYWIGMSWFKQVNTSTTTTSTSTTTTSPSTRTTSISTTAATPSITSSKLTLSLIHTTGLRTNHTSNTVQTSKKSSSDGINVLAVAVPITVIMVAILALVTFIIIYKKRKLCFKNRRVSIEKEETNIDSAPDIPEIISSMIPSSVPPGSTSAPFQRHYPNVKPITAIESDIQSNHIANTMINSTTELHETLKETKTKSLAKGNDGLFVAPAATPVIEEQKNLKIEKKRRKKRKEKRRKDKERLDEDGAEQDDANFNVVHIKPNGGNIDATQYLKKYSDELVDVPTVASGFEEQTDLPNEGPKKKHRKHRKKKKKKHKKRDHEQNGIEFSKDEHDDAAVNGI